MRASPGFALGSILALGVGISLNTAIRRAGTNFSSARALHHTGHRPHGSFNDYRTQVQSAQMIAYKTSPFPLILISADPQGYFDVQVSEDLLRLASR